MADPTPGEGKNLDAVLHAYQVTVGSSPAVAVGSALQALAHAAGLQMLNATRAYQLWSLQQQAATAQAANEVLLAGAESANPDGSGTGASGSEAASEAPSSTKTSGRKGA